MLLGSCRPRRYRGKDRPTDVLSFPLADALQPSLLGEVVISVETAVRQAQRRGHSLPEELQTLLKKKPNNPTYNNDLGYIWADHDMNLEESEKLIRKAIEEER